MKSTNILKMIVIMLFLTNHIFGQGWCSVPDPSFCPGNQFDNGNFETITGNPNTLPDQDINLAVGWSALWQTGSLADLFCEGTSPAGMTSPAPLSGNFAGMWISNTDEQTVATWREGMFNLLLTPIPNGSGIYTFTFDVANLQPSNTASVEIGIYGINYNPTNPLPATPAGSHTPNNLNLFGPANSVELGVIPVNGVWTNTWASQTLTFDSSMSGFPTAGITHIMITHSELQTPTIKRRYMGFDNFCLQCSKAPATSTFSVIIDSPDDPATGIDQNDQGYSGIEDSGGGLFCIAGDSYGYNGRDVFVNILDGSASLVSSMTCEATGDPTESARWMNEILIPNPSVPAGGYLYTGLVGDAPDRDMFIKATDKAGAIAYAQIFDPTKQGDEVGNSVIQDSQGEFVAVGRRIGQFGTTIYAAALDANFGNKWVMEYLITGRDIGWSVIEMPGLQGVNGGLVYGITGQSDNQVVLLLINAIDGTPYLPQGAMLYDLDNDPNTADIGYSINVDLAGQVLITGSSVKVGSGGPVALPYSEMFILKIDPANLQNSLATPGFISSLLFYNIPNSDNEWARHITPDRNNDYILTGKHNVPQFFIQGTEDGEAFLMSVQDNGTLNWINTYTDPRYNGSKGARVEPVSTGGYFMTGSIWTNADPDGDGISQSYYDQFAVCTDQAGMLNNCVCCAPIEVEISEGYTEPWYGLEFFPDVYPDVWHIFSSTEVDILDEYCDQYTPPQNPCDSLTLTLNPDPASGDNCCYTVDIYNQYGNNIIGLKAEMLTADWIFNTGSVNVPGGWTWAGIPGATELNIQHNSGTFPTGATPNVLRFCPADANPVSPTSQQIQFTWYELVGNDTIAVCDTLVITNCESNPGEECAAIINDMVECDSLDSVYKLTFEVFNYNTTQTANNVVLYGNAGYTFRTTSAGPDLNSMTIPVSIPPVSSSGSITIYIKTNTPVTSPTNIYFNYGITGQGFCCWVTQPFCIELPPCYCLITSNFNIECIEDSSKYRLTFDVTNKSTLSPAATALVVTVKNPSSSGISLPPTGGLFDWSSNPLPYDSTRTVTTCVDPLPISDPNLILGYTLHHGTFPWPSDSCCTDIPCDTIPIPKCCENINGDFEDFTGTWNGTNTWINNDLTNWFVSHGTPTYYFNPSIGMTDNGMWMWSYNDRGEGVYTDYNFVAGNSYTLCYDLYKFDDANPTSTFRVELANNLTPGTATSGGEPIPNPPSQLVSNQTWVINGTWEPITETFTAGTAYSQAWFYPYLAGAPNPNQAAVVIDNVCIVDNGPADECCTDYEAFCQRVDAGFNIAFNNPTNCSVGVSPLALNSCDQVLWSWGDGTTSTAPWNASATHTYPAPGTYTICMIVRETDGNGEVCWEKEFCRTVEVNCLHWEYCDPVIDLGTLTLPTGTIHAQQEVISSGTVPAGTNVSLKARQCIRLDGGFNSDANADLEILIEDCTPD